MAAISVIIPVYNGEKHLRACIDSLLAQTFADLEFIFVNDGSTDSSPAIIASYTDSRIRIISQPNAGVSAARNTGVAAAAGEYIGFVDADDTVAVDYFETLYSTASEHRADVVVATCTIEQDGHIIRTTPVFKANVVFDNDFARDSIIPFMIRRDNLNASWSKLYDRRFLLAHDMRFPVGVALGEDGIFNIHVFFRAGRIVFLDYPGYHYREVAGSASRDLVSKDYFARALEVFYQDYNQYFPFDFDRPLMARLKAACLIDKVLSYSVIYLRSGLPGSYRYVQNMIRNREVQTALRTYGREVIEGKSRFEKFMLFCMKFKWTLGLLAATRYSTLRNQKQ